MSSGPFHCCVPGSSGTSRDQSLNLSCAHLPTRPQVEGAYFRLLNGPEAKQSRDMQLPGEFRQIICQHSGSPTVLNPFHVSWRALEEVGGGGSLEQTPRPRAGISSDPIPSCTPSRTKAPPKSHDLAQSCLTLTLWNPIDCSPPGSSVQGILQARILEWVAISYSRGSS